MNWITLLAALFGSPELAVYFTIFLVALLLLIITALAGELFEIGDFDFGDYPSPFSSRVIFAGLVGFGGGGWIAAYLNWPTLINLIVALLAMFAITTLIYFLIAVPMYRQESNSVTNPITYIGTTATVSSAIPKGGIGRVMFIAADNRAYVSWPARAKDATRLPINTTVTVVEVGPTVLTVEPQGGSQPWKSQI